jgi:hypothetical protein
MPVRPIAERRQSNDCSYQQENHDEFGIFNDEGSHGTLLLLRGSSFTHSSFGRKISARLRDECELRHRGFRRFHTGWKGEGVFLPSSPLPDFWRGFFIPNAILRAGAGALRRAVS